jgi:hypothetical protein
VKDTGKLKLKETGRIKFFWSRTTVEQVHRPNIHVH